MRFVEDTGANLAAIQLKAVEMEIEQQKREWEEKRLEQLKQEELEKQRVEREDNDLLTYSREDALNKVNIKSNKKSLLGKRKQSENANHSSSRTSPRGKNSNSNNNNSSNNSSGSQNGSITRNGILKENDKSIANDKKSLSIKSEKLLSSPNKNSEGNTSSSSSKRATRNAATRTSNADESLVSGKHVPKMSANLPRRALSRKSDRSGSSAISKVTNARSTSESTTHSTNSMSRQTPSVQDDSDSECSLDVMIDSNDVNDSDSNSNHHHNQNQHSIKNESNFDSTSQDDDTLLNDDSTMTDETTVDRNSKNSGDDKKSTPRNTRSRGVVKIDLWSLDESPILPAFKRQRSSSVAKSISETPKREKLPNSKEEFTVRECKVSLSDCQKPKLLSPPSRNQKRLSNVKNNHTLDSWIQKKPEPVSKQSSVDESINDNNVDDIDDDASSDKQQPKAVARTRQTRNAMLTNKTL
jgi:hypothetical protein